MPDDRKPRGHWKEQDGDAWSLMLENGYYQVRGNDGSWFVEEHRSYFGNEPTLCCAWGEEFDAKEEAMVAVEEEILSSATFDLQQIGLPPLGEVIEGISKKRSGVQVEIWSTTSGGFMAWLTSLYDSSRPPIEESEVHDTADAAVRDVAAKLGEARP